MPELFERWVIFHAFVVVMTSFRIFLFLKIISGSKLFAKVMSRWQKLPLEWKELRLSFSKVLAR